jgi:hypothetical protein
MWHHVGLCFQLAAILARDGDRLPLVEVVFELVEAVEGGFVEVEVEEAGNGGESRV